MMAFFVSFPAGWSAYLVLERRNELVLEFGAEDGAATTTGTGRVTTLNHESCNSVS